RGLVRAAARCANQNDKSSCQARIGKKLETLGAPMPKIPSISPLKAWFSYIDQLVWVKGSLDDTGNRAFLRAGSLSIPEQIAFDEVIRRIVDAGAHPRVAKLQHQLSSAYARAKSKSINGVTSYSCQPKWPANDLDAIRQLTLTGPVGLYDLIEASPVHWDD